MSTEPFPYRGYLLLTAIQHAGDWQVQIRNGPTRVAMHSMFEFGHGATPEAALEAAKRKVDEFLGS